MSKWSKELQEKTRHEVFPGAVLKNENHNYGIYFEEGDKVVIKGIIEGGFMPMPNDKIIAAFSSIIEMIDAGWVID